MSNIGLLLICLLSGYILRKTRILSQEGPKALNQLIIYFFIPILTLHHVPKLVFQWEFLWLSLSPFLIYLGSYLYFQFVKRVKRLDRPTEGALIMSSGIGSISFVGFPIFDLLYGSEGLAYGILLSLAGTLIVFNTLGLATGLYYSGKSKSPSSFLRRLFSFPPLVAFLLALTMNITGFQFPAYFQILLEKLTEPFSVLALLAIGSQIDLSLEKELIHFMLIGQLYKLVLAPLLMYALIWQIFGVQNVLGKVCILGAAIGSMNAVSILAAQLNLRPRLAILMPSLSIPISILSLFFIDYLLG
ncbi:MAG: AEC family transporter [Bacteroidota bacterium]